MFFKILALKHFAIIRIKKRLQHRYFPVSSSHREVFFKKGVTAQKMKFSIKYFLSKCDQIRRKLETGNWGFGHIYWRNTSWKTSFFVQWVLLVLSFDSYWWIGPISSIALSNVYTRRSNTTTQKLCYGDCYDTK